MVIPCDFCESCSFECLSYRHLFGNFSSSHGGTLDRLFYCMDSCEIICPDSCSDCILFGIACSGPLS